MFLQSIIIILTCIITIIIIIIIRIFYDVKIVISMH